jgi:hypothetical protein
MGDESSLLLLLLVELVLLLELVVRSELMLIAEVKGSETK